MDEITTHELTLFFLQIGVMLAVALFCGQMMRKLRQPAVLGELIGGILLGPTVFGAIFPHYFGMLFPPNAEVAQARGAIISIGMLFFLFVAGLEVNLGQLAQRKWTILSISFFGCLLPFGLGYGAVFLFPVIWGEAVPTQQLNLALFIGTALSISALPVITRILMDLGLARQALGGIILTAATINDLIGWSLFAVLLSGLSPNNPSAGLGLILGEALLFTVLILGLGRWLGRPALKWVRRSLAWPGGFMSVIIILILIAAALAEAFGVHTIFGAFLIGVALSHVFRENEEEQVSEIIHHFAISFFAPLYFISVGLRVDFVAYFDLKLVLLVILLATLGKVIGASFGAWISGIKYQESLAIGFGMNARGAMEMILASVALEFGLIDQRLFVALVIMALVTSMLSGPMLQWIMRFSINPAIEERVSESYEA